MFKGSAITKRFVSSLIVVSLIITTPGLDCYRALAEGRSYHHYRRQSR
ncbi:MAG: hypothetical protein HY747_10510 [Elusimicrobia bacterium]|nr:hypothetical protein [Elusimicrobiota bacterium]